ncbi:MAG: hypothetical protein HC883_04155 [Bdellovibrionaceae bacterium]|nr:hypothetical protein [Pseudobdellovibrionaceae bacterium]
MTMKRILIVAAALFSGSLMANDLNRDMLVKVAPENQQSTISALQSRLPAGTKVEDLGIAGWTRVLLPKSQVSAFNVKTILNMPGVMAMEKMPNWAFWKPSKCATRKSALRFSAVLRLALWAMLPLRTIRPFRTLAVAALAPIRCSANNGA